jgi:hypothetical protein
MNGQASWLSFAAVSGPAKMACGGPGLIGVFRSSRDSSIWPIELVESVGSLDFSISRRFRMQPRHTSPQGLRRQSVRYASTA